MFTARTCRYVDSNSIQFSSRPLRAFEYCKHKASTGEIDEARYVFLRHGIGFVLDEAMIEIVVNIIIQDWKD
jgi:hypothetical protein